MLLAQAPRWKKNNDMAWTKNMAWKKRTNMAWRNKQYGMDKNMAWKINMAWTKKESPGTALSASDDGSLFLWRFSRENNVLV